MLEANGLNDFSITSSCHQSPGLDKDFEQEEIRSYNVLHRIVAGDRLMNLVLGRLSKDWIGLTGCLDQKNGSFLRILDRTEWGSFLVWFFLKRKKLIDTGFFPLVFRGSWISNLLDGFGFFSDTE